MVRDLKSMIHTMISAASSCRHLVGSNLAEAFFMLWKTLSVIAFVLQFQRTVIDLNIDCVDWLLVHD